jgi:hypothetical protein
VFCIHVVILAWARCNRGGTDVALSTAQIVLLIPPLWSLGRLFTRPRRTPKDLSKFCMGGGVQHGGDLAREWSTWPGYDSARVCGFGRVGRVGERIACRGYCVEVGNGCVVNCRRDLVYR